MSLRLVENPVDRLARTVEALLVIAPSPLSIEELAATAAAATERVETALGLLASRYREGRSGIVLEHVAGGYAFRAAREAAAACSRLVERPVQRGLSQAALETLAVVAYLGPVSRPEIARIRGVAADSAGSSSAVSSRKPGARARAVPCATRSHRSSSASSASRAFQSCRAWTTSSKARKTFARVWRKSQVVEAHR